MEQVSAIRWWIVTIFYTIGSRKFTVAEPRKFFHFYWRCKEGRYFYEVIQEKRPCRLYFDLEFNVEDNPNVDCMDIFDDFVVLVQDVLEETLSLTVPRSRFLVLDSTNEKKYSAHVIVYLPDGQLFPSNEDIQPLINLVSGRGVEAQKLLLSKTLSKQPIKKRP